LSDRGLLRKDVDDLKRLVEALYNELPISHAHDLSPSFEEWAKLHGVKMKRKTE